VIVILTYVNKYPSTMKFSNK